MVQDSMFHSWLMGTEGTSTPSITHQQSPSMMQTTRAPKTIPVEDNRNSEPDGFLESSGSLSNQIYQADMDWTFNHAFISMPEPATSADVTLTAVNQSHENSQTDRSDEICWLRSSTTNTRSADGNESNSDEPIAITADDDLGFLSEMCLAMKDNTIFVNTSWQSMGTLIDHLPAILGRREAVNISQRVKMNFLWSKVESFAIDFNRSILPPFIHQRLLLKDVDSQVFDFANLPEPLANCKNIVPMYMQKTPACTKLVLKTLLLEVQRLHTEVCAHEFELEH